MIKVIYNLRFWCNVEKTQCNDFPQVMICDKVLIEGTSLTYTEGATASSASQRVISSR